MTYTDHLKNAQADCAAAGHPFTIAQVRSVLKATAMQGQPMGSALSPSDLASAFRSQIFVACGSPDWMLEPDEALRLVTWIGASDESVDEAAKAFASQPLDQRTSPDGQEELGQ
jgi:hypothetical protein